VKAKAKAKRGERLGIMPSIVEAIYSIQPEDYSSEFVIKYERKKS
jgi:hypothetical protein